MKFHKYILLASLTMSLGAGIIATNQKVEASTTNNGTVIDERWGKPTFVAGAGLSNSQLTETMNVLGITSSEVNQQTATGADLIKYLGSGSGDDSVMLSSVVVNRTDSGSGITVDILTPANITQISADQYKNPLVTAGITDASVKVASVVKVTGESALTGVYKAFEANGETIDTNRAQLAQDELDTTSDVSQNIIDSANSSNDSTLSSSEQEQADEAYKSQLNQTLVEIKQELADLKEQNGSNASTTQITTIVNNAIQNNNLTQYISQADIDKLVSLAERYQTTDGVLDAESIAQLDKISSDFKDNLNKITDKLGSFGDQLKGTIEDNQGFFTNLWNTIKNFFTNLTN
ncbi:DUF1002 domain-containing protein [Enterococcus alishanensis]|uniref:DUF1002 domain-containing protein n=1 Tax=Enterococcus alishanensis TaxID=1303817 RepID=A0ABS6TBG1_9ENTE|nr:DUF1002 domain-containing protein [Enterococcus alishanensis]MBV7390246.1 DUF1002 domain-containing protein [Enterococcus alishanensis]